MGRATACSPTAPVRPARRGTARGGVEEAQSPTRGLFGVGGGGYQGAESAEETRRREAREFAEAEHWARVEREDEAREEARAPGGSREEKAREKRNGKRENAKAKEKASKAKASSASDEKWADFDRRWAALESEDASSAYPTLTYERVRLAAAHDGDAAQEPRRARRKKAQTWKAAYRASLMRWHPDKFAARHARRLHEDDRERILTRVNAVARAITAAFAKG